MSRKVGLILVLLALGAGFYLYSTLRKEPEPVPGLSVSLRQPALTTSRSQVDYNITVTNTGNCDLNVSVRDSLGFTWEGLLPRGEPKTLRTSFQAPATGALENKVEAIGYYRGLKISSSHTATTKVEDPKIAPGLSVSIEQPSSTTSGSQVSYSISLENTGNCDLNVSVTDSLGFTWHGFLLSGESKVFQASFEAPVAGMVENMVEAVGFYQHLKVSSSDMASTKVEVIYSLVDAVEQGIASTEFRGTGYCAGDSIQSRIKSEVEFEVEIEIEPGWVLINSGSGQNMIIAEETTITLKPKAELEITIEAYCLDIEKSNPSSEETLSLQAAPGPYETQVVELMRFVRTAPRVRRSVKAVQIALWVLLGDVSKDDIRISHSDSDILDAEWLLENIGMDVSARRIFREIYERPTLPLEIIQHVFFEDTYIHIMGEVENIGENPLAGVEIKTVFYDISGTIVWVRSDYAMRDTLFPGEKSPFHIWIWKNEFIDRSINFTGYEIWPEDAYEATYVPYREFEVSNISVEEREGELYVKGEVKNIGSVTSTVEIVMSVYDESGKLVGCASHFNPGLEPSQTWSFEIEHNILVGKIRDWIIYVEGYRVEWP